MLAGDTAGISKAIPSPEQLKRDAGEGVDGHNVHAILCHGPDKECVDDRLVVGSLGLCTGSIDIPFGKLGFLTLALRRWGRRRGGLL
jgi:hypothetical protein